MSSIITLPRETVQQALEALEAGLDVSPILAGEAEEALRAALAQQAEPDHETRAELAEQQVVQLAEERDHYRNLWQKAQQDEPVQEPAYKVEIAGRWHDAEPLSPAFSLPDGEHLLYTAPRKAEPVLQALRNLVSLCQRMDLEHQAERPSEAEYQTAMQAAQEAIHAVEGGA